MEQRLSTLQLSVRAASLHVPLGYTPTALWGTGPSRVQNIMRKANSMHSYGISDLNLGFFNGMTTCSSENRINHDMSDVVVVRARGCII